MEEAKVFEDRLSRIKIRILTMGVFFALHTKAKQMLNEKRIHVHATTIQMCVRRWFLRRQKALKKEIETLYTCKPEKKAPTRKEKTADALGLEVKSIQRAMTVAHSHPLLGRCTQVVDDVSFFGDEQIIGEHHLFRGMLVGGRLIMQLQDQSSGRTQAGVCYLGYKKRTRTVGDTIRTWNVVFVGVTKKEQRSGRVTTTMVPGTSVMSPNGSKLVSKDMKETLKSELYLFMNSITPAISIKGEPESNNESCDFPVHVQGPKKRVKQSPGGSAEDLQGPKKKKKNSRGAAVDPIKKPRRLTDYIQFNKGIQRYLTGLTFPERTKKVSRLWSLYGPYKGWQPSTGRKSMAAFVEYVAVQLSDDDRTDTDKDNSSEEDSPDSNGSPVRPKKKRKKSSRSPQSELSTSQSSPESADTISPQRAGMLQMLQNIHMQNGSLHQHLSFSTSSSNGSNTSSSQSSSSDSEDSDSSKKGRKDKKGKHKKRKKQRKKRRERKKQQNKHKKKRRRQLHHMQMQHQQVQQQLVQQNMLLQAQVDQLMRKSSSSKKAKAKDKKRKRHTNSEKTHKKNKKRKK